jgi:hypothetical protein
MLCNIPVLLARIPTFSWDKHPLFVHPEPMLSNMDKLRRMEVFATVIEAGNSLRRAGN